MLASPNRLRKAKEFEAVYRRGRRQNGPLFNLIVFKNGTGATRFAFVVGKKTEKTAVGRNLVKRRLREAARKLLPNLNPGFDVVIMIKAGALKSSFQDLQKELARMLNVAKVLKN